jgi:hypothetical protein
MERRKHKREKISPHLKILIPRTGETFGAFITNISHGGVEVYTDRIIPDGSEVQLSLSFTSEAGAGKEEVVAGDVRWVKPSNKRYLVGTEFKGLNPSDHPMLCDLLDFVK